MKPPRFKYAAPSTLDEAVAFLSEQGDSTKVLAGGQSLMPMLNMRLTEPEFLLDVNRIDSLSYIRPVNGSLEVGALTRHHQLADSPEIASSCPLITKCLPFVGHTAIRYRGTIGGSIVHADPAAELAAAAVALDADFVLRSASGERTIAASDFFLTYFTTDTRPDELLVAIRLPAQPAGSGSAVMEIARRQGDFALAGILAAGRRDGDGRLHDVRLATLGAHEVPLRLREVEALVEGQPLDDALLDEAGARARELVEPESDMHASASYRRRMIGVLVGRALREAAAVSEAGGS